AEAGAIGGGREPRLARAERQEPAAHVLEPHPLAAPRRGARVHRVLDVDDEARAVAAGLEAHRPALHRVLHAVLDGVLHQRLGQVNRKGGLSWARSARSSASRALTCDSSTWRSAACEASNASSR